MAHDDPDTEFTEATDEIYGLDPQDFVPARNALARRLRKEGNRELADRVAKLRRPSPAAWAVNQLARRHREDLQDLLRLGDGLRSAQERALAGADAAELREAARLRRDAVARLAESAARILEERGTGAGAHNAEIAATLEAASLDQQAAVEAWRGRLTSGLEAPSGFGELGGDLTASQPVGDRVPWASERRPEAPAGGKSEAAELLAEARRASSDARRLATDRAAEARRRAEVAARRHREVADAEEGLTRTQRALDEARRRADAAERDAAEAQRDAAEAEAAAAEAVERLREAERRSSGHS